MADPHQRSMKAKSPYLKAKIEVWKDIKEDSIELAALTRNAQSQFQEIIKLSPAMADQVKIAALNTEDPGNLTDLIVVNLNLSLEERQQMLETNSVKERLTRLLPMLNREHRGADAQFKNPDRRREFHVQDASAISFCGNRCGPSSANWAREMSPPPKRKICGSRLRRRSCRKRRKKVALQELERLQQMSPAMAEYGVTRHYLDWIINLPWTQTTEDKMDLKVAKRILDEQHFGLAKVKDRLLEFLAVIKLKKADQGSDPLPGGTAGRGQDFAGKSVADALGRKFARIALGGMRDEAEIRGHRRTYVGALPGRIFYALRRGKQESGDPAGRN